MVSRFFANNIAGQSWRAGDMSTAIRLDYRAVAWSLNLPRLPGALVRLLAAALGPALYVLGALALGGWAWLYLLPLVPLASNRLEPLPAGGQAGRWQDRPT